MDDTAKVFLEELCDILKSIDQDSQSIDNNLDQLVFLFPNEQDQWKLRSLMADEDTRRLLFRIMRHAATSAIFHVLVLFDEGKELGSLKIRPSISLKSGDKDIKPPSYLHELLGEVMQDCGMVTDDWW